MPKREMVVGLVEKTSRKSFFVDKIQVNSYPMKPIHNITVDKGILTNAVVNVNTGIKFQMNMKNETLVRAYQDMMGWFVPIDSGRGTLLIAVMKVDLGPDIPRFAFKTALSATVAWSMSSLRKLSDKLSK